MVDIWSWCAMTLSDLESLLRNAGVPETLYVTDGGLGAGECVGLETFAGGWRVYYSERGQKTPLESFADEDGACREMVRQVVRMMRDSGVTVSPDLASAASG
jgi:hypothetical protein